MVPAQLVFPTNYEINMILQDLLPVVTMDDPIFGADGLFPIDSTEYAKIQWEQLDNYTGLTQLRGIDGQPGRVNNVGLNVFEMDPGYYGDMNVITESDMTKWRKPGTYGDVWDLTQLTMMRQEYLLNRAINRLRQVCWTLASTGTFSVAGPGGLVHTDTFPLQTFATVVPWSTAATATPLADFRSVKLQHRGHSVNFGNVASAWMNQKTYNYMIANTNAADLYGRRTTGLATINSVGEYNQAIATRDDLPDIKIYDEGYLDDTGTFQPFIPDNKVVVIGKRPGNARLGQALFTRNASQLAGASAGADQDSRFSGFVMKIVNKSEDMPVGAQLELGLGFNWGPTVEYPSAVVVMDVGHTGS